MRWFTGWGNSPPQPESRPDHGDSTSRSPGRERGPNEGPRSVASRVCAAFKSRLRVAVRAALDSAIGQLGGLDVLVNNAGIGAQGGIEDNPDEEWRRVLDVNVVGLVRVTRAALPALRASRSAAIINTCSVAATVGLPERVLYSASTVRSSTCCYPSGATWRRPGGSSSGRCVRARSRQR
jgi:short chain dehydrogenase